MDYPVRPASAPLCGPYPVPPSKSEHQRFLVLSHLAGRPARLVTPATGAPGDDVRALGRALSALGGWQGESLGTSRESLQLDLGEGATGFRYAVALATLRPAGARTLVRGRPVLLARRHATLLRALRSLGGHVERRRSGAVRIVAGGMRGGSVTLDASVSSQFASTLMLLAPRIGGLRLRLTGGAVSRPYLEVTRSMLAAFGIPVAPPTDEAHALHLSVPPGVPCAEEVFLAPDASSAAAWWAAAALCGGEAHVPGLGEGSAQADLALLPLLERMGARVDRTDNGDVRVVGDGTRLRAVGEVDLRHAPDLVFLLGVLAAGATGTTILRGLGPTRGKESDRVAVLAAGIAALGGVARIDAEDGLQVEGRPLHGGRVDTGGDHRAAFAFGILGLRVPGIRLGGGLRAVDKSHPGFFRALAALAGERSGPAVTPVP